MAYRKYRRTPKRHDHTHHMVWPEATYPGAECCCEECGQRWVWTEDRGWKPIID